MLLLLCFARKRNASDVEFLLAQIIEHMNKKRYEFRPRALPSFDLVNLAQVDPGVARSREDAYASFFKYSSSHRLPEPPNNLSEWNSASMCVSFSLTTCFLLSDKGMHRSRLLHRAPFSDFVETYVFTDTVLTDEGSDRQARASTVKVSAWQSTPMLGYGTSTATSSRDTPFGCFCLKCWGHGQSSSEASLSRDRVRDTHSCRAVPWWWVV